MDHPVLVAESEGVIQPFLAPPVGRQNLIRSPMNDLGGVAISHLSCSLGRVDCLDDPSSWEFLVWLGAVPRQKPIRAAGKRENRGVQEFNELWR